MKHLEEKPKEAASIVLQSVRDYDAECRDKLKRVSKNWNEQLVKFKREDENRIKPKSLLKKMQSMFVARNKAATGICRRSQQTVTRHWAILNTRLSGRL